MTSNDSRAVQVGNTIKVREGSDVTYTVSKEGYRTQSQTMYSVSENKSITINLVQDVNVTLTFDITPVGANLEITPSDPYAEIAQNSVTADYESTVAYQVTATGYHTFATAAQLTTDTVATINLLPENYRAGWTNNGVTVYTNSIDPRGGDYVYAAATDGSSSGTVAATTKDVSTGLITTIYVGETTYTRDATKDASNI